MYSQRSGLSYYLSLRGPIVHDVPAGHVDALLRHLGAYGISGAGTEVIEQVLPEDPGRRTLQLPEWVSEDQLQAALEAFQI